MGTVSLTNFPDVGTVSELRNPPDGTVSKADNISGVTLGNNIEGLLATALVRLEEGGIDGVGSVTAWNNSGTGGASYDLDTVVGTGANLKPHPTGSILGYGASGDFASTPNSAAVSVLGDIDIRWYGYLDAVAPAAAEAFGSKFLNTGGNRSYFFGLNTNGTLQSVTSADGVATITSDSTAAPSITAGTLSQLRFTLDVDDGLGNHVVRFWEGAIDPSNPDVILNDGSRWDQVGDPITTAGTTSLFNSTAVLEIGSRFSGTQRLLNGSTSRFQVFDGIDGTKVADANPALDYTVPDATSFVSSDTGETWTLNGNTFIQNSGHKVAHSIGGAGLETTVGQTINSPATVFAISRSSNADPSGNTYIFDARSNGAARMAVFNTNGAPEKYALFQGAQLTGPDFDADPHVITCQFNGDLTSKITVSGNGSVTGNAGAFDFDFGSIFVTTNGTGGWGGNIQALIVFDSALSEDEITSLQNYFEQEYNL